MFDYTVTIVAYRNYEDIRKAVASLDKYTAPHIEKKIYIVDNSDLADGDTDKDHFIRDMSEYPFVEYLDMGSNVGFGKANNYVIDRIESSYHVIMNPDILFIEDSLTKIKEYMDNETMGMCIPRMTDAEGNMQLVYRRDITLWDMVVRTFLKKICTKRMAYHTMRDMDYSKPFQVPFGQGSFLVIRTELFKELKGFDDRFFMYMEDADLCKRVNQISRLMYYPDTTVVHRWEKGSHKNRKLFKVHMKSMMLYFKKWGFR